MPIPKLSLLHFTLAAGISQAAVIADFQTEFSATTPATGWGYLWNPTTSALGVAADYVALLSDGNNYTTDGTGVGNGQVDSPFLQVSGTAVHPGSGTGAASDSNDHAAILAYTVQAGEEGTLSLINSSASRSGRFGPDGTFLSVYLNDTFIDSVEVPRAANTTTPGTATFDFPIGDAIAGDVVYIAVGAGTGDGQDGLTNFNFQIDSVPEPSTSVLTLASGLLLLGRRKR